MVIELQSVCKSFYDPNRGQFNAADNVSFRCVPGEVFGLLGPNGAGKSTIMRMIATVLKPSSGTIKVEDFDTLQAPDMVRTRIGFLSADTGLYERLTPREILTYFARLNRVPENEVKNKVAATIDRFSIGAFADTLCGKLSTGMKQRVSIARAVVHEPPVLILDEPTSGLDIMGIRAIHEFVDRCKTSDKCLLFSTHVMAEAEKICDRIGLLYAGKLMSVGTLQELREKAGEHYLEDIFLKLVPERADELA